jgi:hypothetical protein
MELFTKIRDFNPVEEVFGNWTPVQSSNISAYRYNASTHVLQVQFHGGRVYGYKDVPENIVDEFASADSKGHYLNSSIKHSYVAEKY